MVEPSAHGLWYEFITTKFVPRVKEDGFGEVIFTRVLSQQVEAHYTYSLQIHLDSMADFSRYQDEIFQDYIEITTPMFGTKVVFFNSVLKKIEL